MYLFLDAETGYQACVEATHIVAKKKIKMAKLNCISQFTERENIWEGRRELLLKEG